MGTRIAIIDLDGVVCDSSARFAKAEEAKLTSLRGNEMAVGDYGGVLYKEGCYQQSDMQRAIDVYWRTAFTPDLVKLDVLMEGAFDALLSFVIGERNGTFRPYFLTSRPETMRAATLDWLRFRCIAPPLVWSERLIMKPLSQQFIKTVVWKAGVIEVLVRVLQADDLLVVDDEHAQQLAADLAGLDVMKLTCVTSLQEAVATIG